MREGIGTFTFDAEKKRKAGGPGGVRGGCGGGGGGEGLYNWVGIYIGKKTRRIEEKTPTS